MSLQAFRRDLGGRAALPSTSGKRLFYFWYFFMLLLLFPSKKSKISKSTDCLEKAHSHTFSPTFTYFFSLFFTTALLFYNHSTFFTSPATCGTGCTSITRSTFPNKYTCQRSSGNQHSCQEVCGKWYNSAIAFVFHFLAF